MGQKEKKGRNTVRGLEGSEAGREGDRDLEVEGDALVEVGRKQKESKAGGKDSLETTTTATQKQKVDCWLLCRDWSLPRVDCWFGVFVESMDLLSTSLLLVVLALLGIAR